MTETYFTTADGTQLAAVTLDHWGVRTEIAASDLAALLALLEDPIAIADARYQLRMCAQSASGAWLPSVTWQEWPTSLPGLVWQAGREVDQLRAALEDSRATSAILRADLAAAQRNARDLATELHERDQEEVAPPSTPEAQATPETGREDQEPRAPYKPAVRKPCPQPGCATHLDPRGLQPHLRKAHGWTSAEWAAYKEGGRVPTRARASSPTPLAPKDAPEPKAGACQDCGRSFDVISQAVATPAYCVGCAPAHRNGTAIAELAS